MKHKSIIYEIIIFSLILCFLIIPPFFNQKITDASLLFNWSFPFKQTGLCIFAVVLYFLSRNLNAANENRKIFYPSMIALSVMFFTALMIKVITKNNIRTMTDLLPQTFFEWLCCFITFGFSSIYEEIIYRFYFCDALKRLLIYAKMPDNRLLFFLTESAGLFVFAFAHFYLGIAAVINAAIAHVVLRFLYKKTNLILNCVIIHFIYNIISLILL